MPESDTGRNLLRSSALRGVSFAVQALISLLMTPVIVHGLGERMYGFWTLVGTFVGYYGLMDMGVSSAVTRYVSRSFGQRDDGEANRVVSTAFALFSVVAVLVLGVTAAVSVLSFVVVRDPAEYRVVRVLLLVLGIRVALSFPARVFAGVLNAHLRHDLTSAATIAQLLVANAAIYAHLGVGGGAVGMSLILLGAAAVEYLLNLASVLRVFPQIRLSRADVRRQSLKDIFQYSWKTLAAQAAGILRSRVSGFIVAGFLGVAQVTYFSIAARLIDYFSELVFSLVGNLAPVFSRYEGEGRQDLIRSRFVLFTKLSVMLTVFVAVSILFYGRAFIERWMGPGFERSYWVVVILAIPAALCLMQTPSSCLLYGTSQHQHVAVITAIDGLVNCLAGIALAPRFGLWGVAFGTSFGPALINLTLYPRVVCRYLNLGLGTYYLRVLLMPILLSLMPLGVYMAAVQSLLAADYGRLVALGAGQACCCIPVIGLLVLNADERRLIASDLMRRLRPLLGSGGAAC